MLAGINTYDIYTYMIIRRGSFRNVSKEGGGEEEHFERKMIVDPR